MLPSAPSIPSELHVTSVFFCDTQEVEAKPNRKSLTDTYQNIGIWFVGGAQILTASGWRPDCARADTVNVPRILPPPTRTEAPIIVHSPEQRRYLPMEGQSALAHRGNSTCVGPTISASASFQRGFEVSSKCVTTPRQVSRVQGWVLGSDSVSTGPPAYVMEGSAC